MSKAIRFKTRSNEPIYVCPYYPVGSIYLSVNSTNPGTIFGGTWEQIKDKFLLCCGNTYSAGSTGGTTTHYHSTKDLTLNINQIPSHTHIQNEHSHVANFDQLWNLGGGTTSLATAPGGPYGGSGYIRGTTATNQYTGGSQAHNHGNTGSTNHLPPYIAIYVWKRVS